MRLSTASIAKTLSVSAVLALAASIAFLGDDPSPRRHGKAEPSYGQAEAETQIHSRPTAPAHADSELEDQASRPIQLTAVADRGDTLADLLIRSGVDKGDASRAIEAISELYDPRALRPGQSVLVSFTRPADHIGRGPFDSVSLISEGGLRVAAHRTRQGFTASEEKRPMIRQLAHFSGVIRGSLFEAALGSGVPSSILTELIRAYSYDVDFQRDIQPGDRFDILFERFVDAAGRTVRDGTIVTANLTVSGESNPIYRYVDASGVADYFNAAGESVRKALLRTPVDGARISSGFGMRLHPILGFSKMHRGVDFAVTTGTPVMAAGSGVIDFVGRYQSYGNYVRIKHDASHATAYAHLSRFAAGIRRGRHVAQGQIIAFSGSTGRSTGPHLHYEVLVHDSQVNPMSVKFQSGTKLAGKDLSHFLAIAKDTNQTLSQTPVIGKVALAKSR